MGELAGMILHLGQPNLYAKLPMHKGGVGARRVFTGIDAKFDAVITAFATDTGNQNELHTSHAVTAFYNTCHMFVHSIVGWNSAKEGLFGKINGYLGQVHHHEMDRPTFHAIIWVDQPNSLTEGGYEMSAVIARGDCHDGVWRPASNTNQMGAPLNGSFTARCINTSTRFYPILSYKPECLLMPAEWSQSSYCYHSFFQPSLASPAFQALLTEFYMLSPGMSAHSD
jgi:hypothetical protein